MSVRELLELFSLNSSHYRAQAARLRAERNEHLQQWLDGYVEITDFCITSYTHCILY
jgi:hypothetical protein